MHTFFLFKIQAGLTSLEVKFHEWEWEEEEEVFTLEHIGLGETSKTYIHRLSHLLILYSALIINAVGLVLSLIVFVIEIIIHKTSLRHAGGVTQDRLEVDHYYQSGVQEGVQLISGEDCQGQVQEK